MLVLINLVNSLDEDQASALSDVNWIQTVWHSDGIHGLFLKCQYKRENSRRHCRSHIEIRFACRKWQAIFINLPAFTFFIFVKIM